MRGISFCLQDGEILGIVGESGSGKTMTALTIAGLLKEQAVLDCGSIFLDDTDLLKLSPRQMREMCIRDRLLSVPFPIRAGIKGRCWKM